MCRNWKSHRLPTAPKICKQNHSADSKECESWRKEKRILEVKHTKNISYPEVRKFIENSIATTTYANIVKPTNNSTQNQGMTPHFHITNLIKKLNTLLELLRERLTNLTIKLHAGPVPKKNLHQHSNETEDPLKNKPNNNSTQTTTNSMHPSHYYKTLQSSSKKNKWTILKAHN